MSVQRGQLVWKVAMERCPINLVPIDTRIGLGSMQTGTQFPQKGNDPGMLPRML